MAVIAAFGSATHAQTKSDAPAPPTPKSASTASPVPMKRAGDYLNQPMRFEPNRGQGPKAAAFVTGLLSPQRISLSASGIQFNVPRGAAKSEGKSGVKSKDTPGTPRVPLNAEQITMNFVAANRSPEMVGEQKMPGVTNYLAVSTSAKCSGIPGFSQVRYKRLYKGIDAVVHSDGKNLEYDFVVAPGSDVNQVRLKFQGARNLSLAKDGSLRLQLTSQEGTVAHEALKAYQIGADGKRQQVAANFALEASGTVGFHVGKYDKQRPLVIDPAVVYYQGYINQPGNTDEAVTAVAFNPRPSSLAGNGDMFIAIAYDYNAMGSGAPTNKQIAVLKLDANGNQKWLTQWGSGSNFGVCDDEVSSMAVDGVGDVYVCGRTNGPVTTANSVQYQVTPNALYPTRASGSAAYTGFIAVLSGMDRSGINGGSLLYSSYLGGENTEPKSIAVSPSVPGVAYVVGVTQNTNLPTVAPLSGHGVWPGTQQAFLTKINTPKDNSYNNSIVFQSYWGGSNGTNSATAVRVSNGSMYVTGTTQASNFPTQSYGSTDPFLLSYHGGQDAFFSLIVPPSGSTSSSSVLASALIGGTGNDSGASLAVYGEFNVNPVQVFLTGTTQSTDFPTINPLVTNSSLHGALDAFVTKLVLNQGSFTIPYSTYLGGNGADNGVGITASVDYSSPINPSKDAVTIVGTAAPVTGIPGLVFDPGGDLNQIFVVKMAMDSCTVLNSFQIGFANDDNALAIADDFYGGLLVGGATKSPNLGVQYPFPYDPAQPNRLPTKFYQAAFDGLVSRIDLREFSNRSTYFIPHDMPSTPGSALNSSDGISREAQGYYPQGWLSLGPYAINVAPGNNIASWQLQVNNNTANNDKVVRLDVFDTDANQVLASREIYRKEFAGTFLKQDFIVPFYWDYNSFANQHRLELRVWHYATSYEKLTTFGITGTSWKMANVNHEPANTGQGRFDANGFYYMDPAQDTPGYLSRGPYITTVETVSGNQYAAFQMSIDNNSANNDVIASLQVYDYDADQIVASMPVYRTNFTSINTQQSFYIPFTWSQSRAGHRLELRNYWYGNGLVKQYAVAITGVK